MILPHDFDFTQGKFQDYVDCPYRFYMRYVLQARWPGLVVDDQFKFEQRMQAGAHFHRLVQQYLMGIPENRIDEMVTALAVTLSTDPDTDLRTWWENFIAYIPPLLSRYTNQKKQPYVETTLMSNLAGLRLLAKCDLILIQPPSTSNNTMFKLVIFDWKTSTKVPRVDWLLDHMQTRLYRFILTQAGDQLSDGVPIEPEMVTMNYWFTSQPENPVSLGYDQEAYQRDRTYLTYLLDKICASKPEDFQRTDDLKQCRFCVYRSHCDRGSIAGDLSAYDDEGLDGGSPDIELSIDDIPEIPF